MVKLIKTHQLVSLLIFAYSSRAQDTVPRNKSINSQKQWDKPITHKPPNIYDQPMTHKPVNPFGKPSEPTNPYNFPQDTNNNPSSNNPSNPSNYPQSPSNNQNPNSAKPSNPSNYPQSSNQNPDTAYPSGPSNYPQSPSNNQNPDTAKPSNPSNYPQSPSNNQNPDTANPSNPSNYPQSPSNNQNPDTANPSNPSNYPQSNNQNPDTGNPSKPSNYPQSNNQNPDTTNPSNPSNYPQSNNQKPDTANPSNPFNYPQTPNNANPYNYPQSNNQNPDTSNPSNPQSPSNNQTPNNGYPVETPSDPGAIDPSATLPDQENSLVTAQDAQLGLGSVVSVELKDNSPLCAGVLLHESVVMSAFNCLKPLRYISNLVQVRVGSAVAGEGGYLYNVYQSYGIDLTLSRPVPVQETWGSHRRTNKKPRAFKLHKTVEVPCSVNSTVENPRKAIPSGLTEVDVVETGKNSLNQPKVCKKSGPMDVFATIQELFEAERYLGSVNPEVVFMILCEPVPKDLPNVNFATFTFYKSPYRPGTSFLVSYSKKTRQLRKILIEQADGKLCIPGFQTTYQGFPQGPTLGDRFVCLNDRVSGKPKVTDEYCDSEPGAPAFVVHGQMFQVNGIALYNRTCSNMGVNTVGVRVFDRQVARTMGQVMFN